MKGVRNARQGARSQRQRDRQTKTPEAGNGYGEIIAATKIREVQSIDPFQVYPFQMRPYMHELILHCE